MKLFKTKNNLIAVGILGVALAIVVVVLGGIPWHHATAPVVQNPVVGNATSTATSTLAVRTFTPHPPKGSVTYEIAQAATQLPGFVQATIDPADVSVGQIQHFTIVTDDPNPIVSVVAEITTDHKTIMVPLTSQGAPSVSMLVPRTITVGADNKLALIDTKSGANVANADVSNTDKGGNIANAAVANKTKFTGQWTVEDTHTAKYQTKFIAKDSAGNENSVTLEWTDPCPFASVNNYGGGTATISGSCDISTGVPGVSSIDGPEHGNLKLAGGTLTVNSGAKLVMNSGYSISFSGGSMAIPSGGQIVLGQDLCGSDNDGDGYVGGSSWTAASSCGSSVARANISGGGFGDCNDNNANVHPGQTAYFTTPTLTDLGSNTYDYNCDGTQTKQYTQLSTITCHDPSYGCRSSSGGYAIGGDVTSDDACVSGGSAGWATTVPACGQTDNNGYYNSCESAYDDNCAGSVQFTHSCDGSPFNMNGYDTVLQGCY